MSFHHTLDQEIIIQAFKLVGLEPPYIPSDVSIRSATEVATEIYESTQRAVCHDFRRVYQEWGRANAKLLSLYAPGAGPINERLKQVLKEKTCPLKNKAWDLIVELQDLKTPEELFQEVVFGETTIYEEINQIMLWDLTPAMTPFQEYSPAAESGAVIEVEDSDEEIPEYTPSSPPRQRRRLNPDDSNYDPSGDTNYLEEGEPSCTLNAFTLSGY